MKKEIKLGDKVRCKITGFEGIAVAKTEFINGCVQIEVTSRIKKGDKMSLDSFNSIGIDINSLERIGDGVNKNGGIEKKDTGGAMRMNLNRRNY